MPWPHVEMGASDIDHRKPSKPERPETMLYLQCTSQLFTLVVWGWDLAPDLNLEPLTSAASARSRQTLAPWATPSHQKRFPTGVNPTTMPSTLRPLVLRRVVVYNWRGSNRASAMSPA